ncbi:hypothetical protein LCGC14_0427640 [marine sediment metagenome]|uniref:Uncharacterized protein n=1 Tax=marine sediment metagenome TaxID=412755 RepID=A0A0F9SVE0_9ZZZZ
MARKFYQCVVSSVHNHETGNRVYKGGHLTLNEKSKQTEQLVRMGFVKEVDKPLTKSRRELERTRRKQDNREPDDKKDPEDGKKDPENPPPETPKE